MLRLLFCLLVFSWPSTQSVHAQTNQSSASAATVDVAASGPMPQELSPDVMGPLRCDGQDPLLFNEMKRAGSLGYGEVWDERTCDQGVAVYGEGATPAWSAWRPGRRAIRAEDQMLALVVPMFLAGAVILILAAAAVLAALARLRRHKLLGVPCPACAADIPVSTENGAVVDLFCPMCGAPCSIEFAREGKEWIAQAHLLAGKTGA